MAELSLGELRALYAAAKWPVSDEFDGCLLGDWMRKHAGPRWRANLRKALGEVSRELAKATFTKRRKT